MEEFAFRPARQEEDFGIVLVVPKKVETPESGFIECIMYQFINFAVREVDSLSKNLPNFIEKARMRALHDTAESLINRINNGCSVLSQEEKVW